MRYSVGAPRIRFDWRNFITPGVKLLVTSRDKRAIEDHFDRHAELEQRLKAGGKEALLASVNELAAKVKIHSVRQPEQRGLGDAVAVVVGGARGARRSSQPPSR